jgi:nucleoporin NUP159
LLATVAVAKTVELKKTSGTTPRKADLGDARKWVFGDIKGYGRLLVDVQTDVKELKSQRGVLTQSFAGAGQQHAERCV